MVVAKANAARRLCAPHFGEPTYSELKTTTQKRTLKLHRC